MTTAVMPGGHRIRVHRAPEPFIIRDTRHPEPDLTALCVEQAPRIRRTRWILGGLERERPLSMPRLLFVILFWRGSYANTYLYVLKQEYQGPDTMLFRALLPNLYSSNKVCMSLGAGQDQLTLAVKMTAGWDAKAGVVLEHFWDSCFSDHLIDRMRSESAAAHEDLSNLVAWQRASRLRPGFVNDVNWPLVGLLREQTFSN